MSALEKSAQRRCTILVLLAGLGCCAPALLAAAMADPTEPPAGHVQVAPQGDAPAQAYVVQSIRLSSAGRSAVVNGTPVKIGDRVGEAVVSRIADAEVVVMVAGKPRVLKLYPGIEKRDASPSRAPSAVRRRPQAGGR
jgi:hypothetical protein